MIDHILWREKYRPKTIEECILPVNLKKIFKSYVKNKEIPSMTFVSSSPGTGKTATALALCEEVGCDYLFINGSSETGIDTFRTKMTNFASSVSMNGERKVIIVDECDRLSPQAMDALKFGEEYFSKNCSFILTTNHKGRLTSHLLSRCSPIEFLVSKQERPSIMKQIFIRICWILDQESIQYDKKVVAEFIAKWFPDTRRVINELQKYSKTGSIDVGILSALGDVDLRDLIHGMKEKDFQKVRKWVVDNDDIDVNIIFRKVYTELYNCLVPSSIPQAILIIGKYQYQIFFVASTDISILACFIEIMRDCEFK